MQANQVIASSTNNQGDGENSTSQPMDFTYGDRLNSQTIDKTKALSISNKELVRQLQTFGDKPESFIMTFRTLNTIATTNSKATRGSGHGTTQTKSLNVVNLTLPDKSLLTALLNDGDLKNNTNVYGGQQPNFTLEFVMQGLSGLRTMQWISFKNFPRPYSDEDVIFQIVDVAHMVTKENWETRIKAAIRPLRDFETMGIHYVDGSEPQFSN